MLKLTILLTIYFSTIAARADYSLLSEIPISTEGAWDYLSTDTTSHKLFVSHSSSVVVIDLKTDKILGEIKDTQGVHGVAVAPELNRAFTSNGKENKVSVVDLKTLATIKKVDVGQGPDAIVYDSGEQEVYAFNGKSQSVSVIKASSGAVVATIPLNGKPESAAVDAKAGKIYLNIEDKNSITVIDTKSHRVTANWAMAPGEECAGMAIDLAHHHLIVGCHNKLMLLVDSSNGKVLDQINIGAGVDANDFDPSKQLAFSSTGEGLVTIARVTDKGKFQLVQNLSTRPRSRTMALDPMSHRIFLPSADFAAKKEGERWPQMIPGTLKILVYGEAK